MCCDSKYNLLNLNRETRQSSLNSDQKIQPMVQERNDLNITNTLLDANGQKRRSQGENLPLISKTKHGKYLWENITVHKIKLVLDMAEVALQENAISGN